MENDFWCTSACFSNKNVYLATLQLQTNVISALTAHEAADIAQGTMDVVGTFATNQPKSAIIGYVKILRRGSHRFGLVKWRLFLHRWQRRSAQSVWPIYGGLMLQDDKVGWKIFQAYCRHLMGTPPVCSFRCRPCCRQRDDEYRNERDFVVGGCNKVRMGLNISSAVFEVDSMTLFHSVDPYHKLFEFDFIYKDIDGTFHAFQVTRGKNTTWT